MDDFEAYKAYEDYENFRRANVRNFRRNFFEDLTDRQFIEFFHFDKEGVHTLVDLLRDYLGEEEESDDENEEDEEEDELSINTTLEFQVNYLAHFLVRLNYFFLL